MLFEKRMLNFCKVLSSNQENQNNLPWLLLRHHNANWYLVKEHRLLINITFYNLCYKSINVTRVKNPIENQKDKPKLQQIKRKKLENIKWTNLVFMIE